MPEISENDDQNTEGSGRETQPTATVTRPVAYNRTTSEAGGLTRLSQSNGESQGRASLERHYSLSTLQESETAVNNPGSSSSPGEDFVNSWSNGFGNSSVFAQSWTTGFGDSTARRVSTGPSTNTPSFPTQLSNPKSRCKSEGLNSKIAAGGIVSSAMHDAARLMDWKRVKEISQQNPSAASFVGQGGYTALHHLCSRRCPHADVAEAVVCAHPDALTFEDTSKGWTPLHLACRFKCKKDVVAKLLNLFPEKGKETVSKLDRQRRTPLFYAVRYDSPPGVVPQLLEVDPSVILAEDQNLESPLALVWDNFAEKLEGKRALSPFFGEHSNATSPDELHQRLEKQTELKKNWKRANMFLKAAFGFPLSEDDEVFFYGSRKWRIVHATAAVKCHPTLFQMACALHPEQASEIDDNDLYVDNGRGCGNRQSALHLAAASNASGPIGRTVITELIRLYPDGANFPDDIDGSYPLHRIVENKCKQHWAHDGIDSLCMLNPAALEKPDKLGKLPLHRAAAAVVHQENTEDLALRSVICNLVRLYPEAASVHDENGCTPLHLAAMNGSEWNGEIESILEANRQAVTVRTGRSCNNSLAIHLAAANPKADGSLVERLVELNPRGVSQADSQGKLPLHLACELGKAWVDDGIEAIHNAYAIAVSTREENARGWTALHMASASTASSRDLLKQLVELNPEACEIADQEGRFPLHLACESGKNWEGGLSDLFEGNPGAISSADSTGRIPLCIVAEQFVLDSTDSNLSLDQSDDSSDQVDVKSQRAGELDVLYNLVRSDPTTLPPAIEHPIE